MTLPQISSGLNPINSYEQIIDALAEEYAEEMGCDIPGSSLLPKQAKKDKLKFEFKEKVKMKELNQRIFKALDILRNEGKEYLPEDLDAKLQRDLKQAAVTMKQFDYKTDRITNFARLLGIGEDSLEAIDSVAKVKYTDEKIDDALSLLVFLTTLAEDNAEYWYELGICFQDLNQFDMALKAYTNCLEVNPNHMGSQAFCTECYLNLDQKNKAWDSFYKAKSLMVEQNLEQEWAECLESHKNLLGFDNGA